ncbi:MAG: S1/P1 Nuclease [Terrimonas sp.]|nr:S1/P1 Nuclease [Terrimonas sp.]
MKRLILLLPMAFLAMDASCWGFFAHKKINSHAVFLLPPEMIAFYKANIDYLAEHAVDPDKRRYAVAEEGPRHYIDLDHYGAYPFDALPRSWKEAVVKYSDDSLQEHGIVPWWIETMMYRLTKAFQQKETAKILKLSAELGHYIADAHVPLHTSSNHNGQKTGQLGIHGFWESRIPELLADKEWDFFIGRAVYLNDPAAFIWSRVLESAAAADTVLRYEAELTLHFAIDQKYAFENRNGTTIRQYSSAFARAYNTMLQGMVERRMRQSIFAIASCWYTAWVNAGQPDLKGLNRETVSKEDQEEFDQLNAAWRSGNIKGRIHE